MNKFLNMNFSGNEWLEGILPPILISLVDDEKVNNDDLDLLVVPQYGRKPDYTG